VKNSTAETALASPSRKRAVLESALVSGEGWGEDTTFNQLFQLNGVT